MANRTKQKAPSNQVSWLDDSENVSRLIRCFFILCGFIILADIIYSVGWHKHAALKEESLLYMLETFPSFYGIFGFVVCSVMVLIAKFLRGSKSRRLLMREEHYWDK